MRRAARIDGNQPDIVKALQAAGATVRSLAAVGSGCPDLLVGFRGQNFLLEVKDGRLPPSERGLSEDEAAFHSQWRGQVLTVLDAHDALRAIGSTAVAHPVLRRRGAKRPRPVTILHESDSLMGPWTAVPAGQRSRKRYVRPITVLDGKDSL